MKLFQQKFLIDQNPFQIAGYKKVHHSDPFQIIQKSTLDDDSDTALIRFCWAKWITNMQQYIWNI